MTEAPKQYNDMPSMIPSQETLREIYPNVPNTTTEIDNQADSDNDQMKDIAVQQARKEEKQTDRKLARQAFFHGFIKGFTSRW